MIRLDVHRVTKVVPEVVKFSDFTCLYLDLKGPDIADNTKVCIFFYDRDLPSSGGSYQVDVPNGPMDLLNALGPAIEKSRLR